MRLDYKTPINNFRLRLKLLPRRTIHIGMTALAVCSLIFGLIPGRSSDPTITSEISLDGQKTGNEIKLAKSKLKQSTGDSKEPSKLTNSNNKEASDANASNESKEGKESKEAKTEAALEEAYEAYKAAVWETIKINKSDTLAKIFKRNGYSEKDLHAIIAADKKSKSVLPNLNSEQKLQLLVREKVIAQKSDEQTSQKALQKAQKQNIKSKAKAIGNEKRIDGLNLAVGPGQTLIITRKENKYEVQNIEQPLEKKLAFGKGTIHASLSGAARQAGLDNKLISQFVEIFGGNIDFSQDLRQNDSFRVLYEQKYLNAEPVQTGVILAAEIVNKGKKIRAVRYTDKNGKSGYFSPDGQGLTQAFLRSPVNFTRISSGFGSRSHPIYHRMRQHKGVDYAAPRGTPVQATADAKVTFAGIKKGYGKVIELQHSGKYSTLYAHLSGFAKNLKAGKEVKQGEVIGFVGRTGLATGNHLHYEFRIAGVHHNPLTVALPKTKYIPDASKRQFLAHAKEILRSMDDHENKVKMASTELPRNPQ